MPTLRKLNWPAGFTPGTNEYNGDPNGLPVATNITFDEQGIIRLSKGTKFESSGPFLRGTAAIYSTVFDLTTLIGAAFPGRARVRYAGLQDGQLVRNYGNIAKSLQDFEIEIFNPAADGSNGIYALGSAFGHTLMFSGRAKYKDRGDLQHELGIKAFPLAPGISPNVPPTVRADDPDGSNFYSRWDATSVEGINYSKAADYIAITTQPLENFSRAIFQRAVLTTTNLDLDAMNPVGRGTSEDFYSFNLRLQYSEYFVKVRVEYMLSTSGLVKDYFWHEWTNRISADTTATTGAFDFIPVDMTQEQINELQLLNSGVTFVSSIREGRDTWTPLTCKRGDFNRVGTDDSLGWNTVKGIRITYYTTQNMDILFNEARFIGGDQGQLTGAFWYIQQDYRDTNSYIEAGMPSPETAEMKAYGTSIHVIPNDLDPQANGFKIYRVSNATDGFYQVYHAKKQRVDAWSNGMPSSVSAPNHQLVTGDKVSFRDGYGNWAFANVTAIVTVTGGNTFSVGIDTTTYGVMTGDISFVKMSAFNDSMSDADALYGGAANRLDRNKSLLPDDIIGMVAPYFGRVLYLGYKAIYPSEQNDPSRYDLRYVIENAADTGEVNLFIAQIAERTMIIGTTKGFYSLVGDGTVVDSIINFKLDTLGIEQPPINSAFTVYNSILYYFAADGIRFINGTESGLLTDNLRFLFPPWEETRFGLPPFRIEPANGVKLAAVTIGSKLYFSMEHIGIGRCLLIYDVINRRWEYRRNSQQFANNPYSLFVEEDGTILFGTADDGDKWLHQLEVGTSYDANAVAQNIELITIFDDDGKPNNRKDVYTLFIDADTGNLPLTIKLSAMGEDQIVTDITFTQAFNQRQRFGFDCSGLGPKKAYRLTLTGNFHTFKVYEYSFEYDDRPTQLNFYRLPPTDWGIAGRKRIPEIPFTIDTMGNTVTFTPIIDGNLKPAVTFNTVFKDIYHFVFNQEEAGYVIGGWLRAANLGDRFEYYGLVTPREIEQLPDPLAYKHIPYTNLGNAARKRFTQFAFTINTFGNSVTFTPSVDGIAFSAISVVTNRRQTIVYVFDADAIGIEMAGILDSLTADAKFEYFGIELSQCAFEVLPPAANFLRLAYNNMGSAARKRFIQYAFIIDTHGQFVSFTPIIDGTAYPTASYSTDRKQTVIYVFTTETIGIEIMGVLDNGSSQQQFEYYGLDLDQCASEVLPPVANFLRIPYNNLGSSERKRFIQFAFIIDTRGSVVTFTPSIDGNSFPGRNYNTFRKQTVIYTFPDSDAIGIDIGGTLDAAAPGDVFEFYGVDLDKSASEVLPPVANFLAIPYTNLGNTCRKRFIQFGFAINTGGNDVTFTPLVDGVTYQPQTFNTNRKQTCIYVFAIEVTGIDIGGTLDIVAVGPTFEFYGVLLEHCLSEQLPPAANFTRIPFNNLGNDARKRFIQIGFVIDTRGNPVVFTPIIDGVAGASQVYNTARKQTVIYTFATETTGIEIGGTLDIVTPETNFEFYGLALDKCVSEVLPPVANFMRIPYTDLGNSSRKRFIQLALTIDTRGAAVVFTPQIDNTTYAPMTITTTRKEIVIYLFNFDAVGIMIGGTLDIADAAGAFEFYGIDLTQSITEKLPAVANFTHIPYNNLGNAARKRFIQYAFTIDTFGQNVVFTPAIDGVTYPTTVVNTARKQTVIHVFNLETIGIEIGGVLDSLITDAKFEFYGVELSQCISETLPPIANFIRIPYTNLGNGSRKRFIQFAFVIDTKGNDVVFHPIVDNFFFPTQTYNTSKKQTVLYTFATEAIGIDIGGALDIVTPGLTFEYYGVDLGECISEKLPPVARYFKIPCNNFGTASRKRVRTIPLVIDTRGGTVTFTPIVDGVTFPSSTHVTNDKRTVLHFFETDAFGIDYCGILTSATDFEYYGFGGSNGTTGLPESVEVLPVAKKFDQLGPLELRRFGRIYKARARVVATGTSMSYKLIVDCVTAAEGTWQTDVNCDQILDISFPKFIMGEVVRLELRSATEFHRMYAEVLCRLTGNGTDNTWIKVK